MFSSQFIARKLYSPALSLCLVVKVTVMHFAMEMACVLLLKYPPKTGKESLIRIQPVRIVDYAACKKPF